MKIPYLIFLTIIISGCTTGPIVTNNQEKRVFVNRTCPKFNAKLDIRVVELNSTHAAISWEDVAKIEAFIASKKKFNRSVSAINREH